MSLFHPSHSIPLCSMHPKRNRREDRTKKKTRITSSEEGDGGREARGRTGGEGKGEESGGDIAEMRWRMKARRGEREGNERREGGRERGGTKGRWEIFNTHFAKTILPLRRRAAAARRVAAHCPPHAAAAAAAADGRRDMLCECAAANGMAFISRQFVDPSLHFTSLLSFCVNFADKFVSRERASERASEAVKGS